MSDSVLIHQPTTMEKPFIITEVQRVHDSHAVTIFVRDEHNEYLETTKVVFFLSVPLEKILEQFPNAKVKPPIVTR